jgi:hypothetical protein
MLIIVVLLYLVELVNSGGHSIPNFVSSAVIQGQHDLSARPRILPQHWEVVKNESSHPIETFSSKVSSTELSSQSSGASLSQSPSKKKKKIIVKRFKKIKRRRKKSKPSPSPLKRKVKRKRKKKKGSKAPSVPA